MKRTEKIPLYGWMMDMKLRPQHTIAYAILYHLTDQCRKPVYIDLYYLSMEMSMTPPQTKAALQTLQSRDLANVKFGGKGLKDVVCSIELHKPM